MSISPEISPKASPWNNDLALATRVTALDSPHSIAVSPDFETPNTSTLLSRRGKPRACIVRAARRHQFSETAGCFGERVSKSKTREPTESSRTS
jgi:hypothetical protein